MTCPSFDSRVVAAEHNAATASDQVPSKQKTHATQRHAEANADRWIHDTRRPSSSHRQPCGSGSKTYLRGLAMDIISRVKAIVKVGKTKPNNK